MKSSQLIQIQPTLAVSMVYQTTSLVRKLILNLMLIVFPLVCSAANEIADTSLEKRERLKTVTTYFEQKISDLDVTLLNNQAALTSDPVKQREFVDQKLLPLWSSIRTLKLILGAKQWKSLSKDQIVRLETSFAETFQRYTSEALKFYDGQRIKVLSIRLNGEQSKGYLTTELSPIYLPRFNITFKIVNQEDDWKLYDIMVEGISYIKMKKNEYRRILVEQGFDALICHLDKKNEKNLTNSLAGICDRSELRCNKMIVNCV